MSRKINPGFVYIFSNPSFKEGLLKIGYSTQVPDKRASELQSTGVPTNFVIEYYAFFDDCVSAESQVHKQLSEYRINQNREFFNCSVATAIHAIESLEIHFHRLFSKVDNDAEIKRVKRVKELKEANERRIIEERIRIEKENERIRVEKENKRIEKEKNELERIKLEEENREDRYKIIHQKEKAKRERYRKVQIEENKIKNKVSNAFFETDADFEKEKIYIIGEPLAIQKFFSSYKVKPYTESHSGKKYFHIDHADSLQEYFSQCKKIKFERTIYSILSVIYFCLCVWFIDEFFSEKKSYFYLLMIVSLMSLCVLLMGKIRLKSIERKDEYISTKKFKFRFSLQIVIGITTFFVNVLIFIIFIGPKY